MTRLLDHLDASGNGHLLSADERAHLASAEVSALPPSAQWEHIRQNRRVGYAVTLFAAGIRLLLLGGGAIAAVAFSVSRFYAFHARVDLGLGIAGIVLGAWVVFTIPKAIARVRALGAPLPELETLGVDG